MLVSRIIAAHLLVFTAVALAPNSWAQDSKCFSIRVLNVKSGKPMRGIRVDMFPNHAGDLVHAQHEPEIHLGKTNKLGSLKYCPPDPAPKTFSLSFYHFDGPDEVGQDFDLGEVLQTGVLGHFPDRMRRLKDDVSVKPGEIVVFGKRWNLIEYIPAPDLP
jgi:hypothetical protein